MSAINKALSQLAENKPTGDLSIQRAEVKAVKQRSVIPWIVGSFALSLAVGGWAISQQAPALNSSEVVKSNTVDAQAIEPSISSPTTKTVSTSEVVYQPAPVAKAPQEKKVTPLAESKTVAKKAPVEKPLLIAKVEPKVANSEPSQPTQPAVSEPAMVVVEQVELTPNQLAEKAKQRAEKALDANNLKEALTAYNEVIRYTPGDEVARKKLSALYYGKGEVRKSVELLQKGIALNSNDVVLRMALAKLLIKEEQNSAALTVLSPLPEPAPVDYLSLRAALAQKLKQNPLALESYQHLVELEPDSGRWWLGLAIQQERAFELNLAKQAYQQAQKKLGLSSQSQQFIRDRLALIDSLNSSKTEE